MSHSAYDDVLASQMEKERQPKQAIPFFLFSKFGVSEPTRPLDRDAPNPTIHRGRPESTSTGTRAKSGQCRAPRRPSRIVSVRLHSQCDAKLGLNVKFHPGCDGPRLVDEFE